MASQFTHIDENSRGQVVDVSREEVSRHTAIARGRIRLREETVQAIKDLKLKKGDVLATAQVTTIQEAKKCSGLIPMAHPLFLSSIRVNFESGENDLYCQVTTSCQGKTGIEMETLSGVSTGLLTVHDMYEALDKSMVIDGTRLMKRTGGKSGDFVREKNI